DLGLGDHHQGRVVGEVPAEHTGLRDPELLGGLDEQDVCAVAGDLPVGGALGDVDVVTGTVGQASELRLELSVSFVDEVQFVPVDVACVERGRLGAAAQ